MNNIDAVFQSFRCPNCDTVFNRTFNLDRHLTTCSELVKTSIRGTYIKSEKLSLTSWTLSASSTRVNKIFMSAFQRTKPECEIESFFTTGRQKKIDCFSVDGFCSHCNTVFQALGCFYHFCPCQELPPSLTEEFIQRGSKKRELVALSRHYLQEKGFKVIETWECEKWRLYKTTNTVKQHIREHFPYRRSLAADQLLGEIKEGKSFGYVQCDFEKPENLRENCANFPPIFKNTFVS